MKRRGPVPPLIEISLALVVAMLAMAFSDCNGPTGPTPVPPPPSPPPPPPPLSSCQLSELPEIKITFVPAIGSSEQVRGTVLFTNAPCDTDRYRVALYIHVPGFRCRYICKPTQASPLTPIDEDGSWMASYDTGGRDETATRIAAFLVLRGFSRDCCVDSLPRIDGAGVLAKVEVTR